EVSGLNVIVDSNVSGKVTLVLDSVPWDQALDIVLRNNGLGRSLDGNVLRISRIATLEQEEGAAAKLEEAKLESGPLVTVIRPLKYARALDTAAAQSTIPGMPPATSTPGLVTILKNLNGVLSKRGDIIADARSNSLIITDVATQIPIIESVVDKLDTKPKQISIEARIVQASSDFVRTLTSALNGGTVNASGSTATGGTTGTGSSAQGNVPLKASASGTQTTNPGLISLGQTVATGFGAYAIANQSARYFINAAIAAAETRDQANLISSPTIITQNNVAGKVAQGVEVPYQTTINNTISTQFKDATLELDVTPQVTQDGNVFLLLYVQDDTVGAVVPGLGASINHQSATTQVLVPDGGTVMFGGIKVTRRAKTATQVPGLGSIPLLGNLFKSSEVDRNDQELIFFVTPKVIPG
ncbi:MAG TPA: type IV pilus secretin PilQ, partial [Terriglobia bacterium]|nr:type IV pilus secretin PilQ [Terriglobia bacterium]